MSSSKHGPVSTSEKSSEKKQSVNASDILSNLKVRVNNKLVIGNLNINSIAGKFDRLKLMVQHKVDILVLTETKVNFSFLKNFLPDNIEGIFIELHLRKHKYLLCATYHPPNQKDHYFFNHLGKANDVYHQVYEKFLLTDDLNAENTEPCLSQFLFEYDAKNNASEKTCFKTTLAVLTFLLQTLLIVFKIHQQ